MITFDPVRFTRRLLMTLFCAALAVLVLTAALSHLIPQSGREVFIIRGASMEPAIPLGSVIAVRSVPPDSLVAGDVVTMRTASGLIVTHRVTAVFHAHDGTIELATKGDANAYGDELRWPQFAIIGRVDFWVPYAGYLLAFVSTRSGLIALLSGMGALLFVIWSLEETETDRRRWRHTVPDATPSA